MGPDEEGKALATPEYWDSRYAQSNGEDPTHEWFRSYEALEPFFKENLFATKPPDSQPKIVHLGTGDSTIPADLAARGYTNQLCLDFSDTALELMRARHAEEKGIEWRWADVRAMEETVASGSVDVAFDKGTLDAMIHGSPWSPPDQVLSDTSRYMREVRSFFSCSSRFFFFSMIRTKFLLLICDCFAR
jgi:SAM-dependent methyltransferase